MRWTAWRSVGLPRWEAPVVPNALELLEDKRFHPRKRRLI